MEENKNEKVQQPSYLQNLGTMPSERVSTPYCSRRNSTPQYYTGINRLAQGISRRRVGIPFYRNNSFPMTVSNKRQTAKFSGNMDLFSPSEFHYSPGGDHVLPNSDLTMYAASPNSLYLYDQEKYDMQNLGNTQCLTNSRSHTKMDASLLDDFDLNPQYENNYELLSNSVQSDGSDIKQSSNFSTYNVQNQNGRNSNVTLTELNMSTESESFLDDLDSVIPKTVPFLNSMAMNDKVNQSLYRNNSIHRENASFLSNSVVNNQPFSNYQAFIKSESVSNLPLWSSKCRQPNAVQNFPNSLLKAKLVPPSQSSSLGTSFYNLPVKREQNADVDDNKSSLHKLLMLKPSGNAANPVVNTSSSSISGQKRSVTSVKDEDDDSVEEKWKEIEKYIHDDDEDEEEEEDSKIFRPTREKRTRYNSGSSFTASIDDSDDDDSSDDDWSDTDVDMTSLSNTSVLDDGKKGEKFFWQYNVQSKGPKGTKLKLHLDSENPHKLSTFEDPVFDPHNSKAGIRHGGKARKGDGNDIVPSPRKLFNLGQQIRKFNHMINEISSNTDQPASVRNEMRKKKNKLASRACRLKKKAQHEANKVKLYGLEKEHSQLLEVINRIRKSLIKRAQDIENLEPTEKEKLINKLDDFIAKHLTTKIAGNATVFVNTVIRAVESGDITGGITVNKKNRK